MLSNYLGSSGLMSSRVGVGCNAFGSRTDEKAAHEILSVAHDAGISLVDTADIYSHSASEEIIGRWMKGVPRDSVIVSTKGGGGTWPRVHGSVAGRSHLVEAVEASLRRLGTDFIDLYSVHFWDREVPLDETLSTLDALVASGKVRHIGLSNHPAWRICQALWIADTCRYERVSVTQASYSLVDRTAEQELLPFCQEMGVGLVTYWPLGGGLLTGKYRPGSAPPEGSRALTQSGFSTSFTDERLQFSQTFHKMAVEHGWNASSLALGWALSRPGVSAVLVGATRPAQMIENLRDLERTIEDSLLSRLEEMSAPCVTTPFREGGVNPK